jgi:hypothetical protein
MINLRESMGLPPLTTLRLTKLDVASRQLRTSIVMFLEGSDPVSTYTLAAAAQDVLRGLLKADGKAGVSFKDSDFIKPEWLKLWRDMANRDQNFFKHADRDAGDVLEFKLEVLPFTLMDGVRLYSVHTGRMLREGSAFAAWYILTYPDVLKPGAFADSVKLALERGAVAEPRSRFLGLLKQQGLWPDAD